MSDKDTQAEQVAELLRLVENVSGWADEHLRKKQATKKS